MSPESLQYHYGKISEGYVEALAAAMDDGEIARADPEVLAWALMAVGEMVGMRWILWDGRGAVPPKVRAELDRLIAE